MSTISPLKIYQDKFGAGLTAWNYSATRVPANTDSNSKAGARLRWQSMREKKKVLAKGDVIEEVHRQKGGPMITSSVCRKCHTAYLGREDVTVSQFRYMRDSKYDVRSHIRKMSSMMFCAQDCGSTAQLVNRKRIA